MSASDHEPGRRCDVFVCHAGQEKWGFVSVIRGVFKDVYPEVEVFVDDWSLRAGDTCEATVKQAMDECAVAILVLSKGFIGKPYPMDELSHFRKRKAGDAGDQLKIITVLFDLKFSDVEDPSLKQRDDITWLTTFTIIRRDQVARGEAYGLACCVVADAVIQLQVLGRVRPYTPEVPVMFGRTNDINRIMEELEGAPGSMCMMLYGVGGIGKTTLANALYQQLLQHPSCQGLCGTFKFGGDASILTQQRDFLEKVLGVQRKRLPGNSEEAGLKMVERLEGKFQGRQLVVVVDNVPLTTTHTGSSDDRPAQQLRRLLPPRLFEPGFPVECKVLLTARDTTTFDEYCCEMPDSSSSNAVARGVGELPKDAALKLFSWHVFQERLPFKAALPQQLPSTFPPCETVLPACDITLEFIRGELQKVVSQCTSHPLVLKLAAFRLRQQYSSIADLCNNLADAVKVTTTWLPGIKANSVHGILEAMYQDVCNHAVCRMHMRDLLLDVAVFLCGRPWKMLEAYQPTDPPGMLKELADKGFLRKAWSGGVEVVDMHDIVREFCLQKAAELGQQAEQRLVLRCVLDKGHAQHDPWDPRVAGLLMEQCGLVSIPAVSHDGAGANPRVVQLSELQLARDEPSVSGASRSGGMRWCKLRWLSLCQVQPWELLECWLEPSNQGCLQVVVLRMLPADLLQLQALTSMRYLSIQDMQLLDEVQGLAQLPELVDLQVVRCAALRHVLHLPATVARLELRSCPLLPEIRLESCARLCGVQVMDCQALATDSTWLAPPCLNVLQLQLNGDVGQHLAGISSCCALQEVDITLAPTLPAAASSVYDVFLSYAPKHRTFAAALYSKLAQLGLHVFLNEANLERRRAAKQSIQSAINTCRLGVVVSSKAYGQSDECLHELQLLLLRVTAGNMRLLPVHRDGYGELFRSEPSGPNSNAFRNLLCYTGLRSEQVYGDESALVERVADSACSLLLESHGDVTVARLRLLQHVQQLLRQEHTMVLLHGVAGSGKTTLLDAVYRSYPEYDCRAHVQLMVDATGEDICSAQQKILSSIDLDAKCEDLKRPDMNHSQLRRAFKEMRQQRRRFWLVVDNAWRGQLQQLLPRNILAVLPDNTLNGLAPGSKVLVSSRQVDAAEGFAHWRAPMPKLQDSEAEQLFQMHCPCDSPQQQSQMQDLVELCDGLPFAICVVAKAARSRQEKGEGWGDLRQLFADALECQEGDYRSKEDGRTMNAAVGLTFDQLESDELRRALLRSVAKLHGRPLKEAKACFGGDVVDHLIGRGLLGVEKCGQQELLAVPEAVSVFCKAVEATRVSANGPGPSDVPVQYVPGGSFEQQPAARADPASLGAAASTQAAAPASRASSSAAASEQPAAQADPALSRGVAKEQPAAPAEDWIISLQCPELASRIESLLQQAHPHLLLLDLCCDAAPARATQLQHRSSARASLSSSKSVALLLGAAVAMQLVPWWIQRQQPSVQGSAVLERSAARSAVLWCGVPALAVAAAVAFRSWPKATSSPAGSPVHTLPRLLQAAALQLRVLKLQSFLYGSLCIEGLQELRLIHLQGLPALTSLTLRSLPALESLSVAACPRLTSISGLGSHPTLRDLSVVACPLLPSLRGISTLQHLEDLELLKLRTLAALRPAEADDSAAPHFSSSQGVYQGSAGASNPASSGPVPPAGGEWGSTRRAAGADAGQPDQQGMAAAGKVAPLGDLSCLSSLKRLRMGGLPGLMGASLGGLRELGALEDVEVLGVGAGATELPGFDQVASLTRLRWSREEPVRR